MLFYAGQRDKKNNQCPVIYEKIKLHLEIGASTTSIVAIDFIYGYRTFAKIGKSSVHLTLLIEESLGRLQLDK